MEEAAERPTEAVKIKIMAKTIKKLKMLKLYDSAVSRSFVITSFATTIIPMLSPLKLSQKLAYEEKDEDYCKEDLDAGLCLNHHCMK